jgi:hypothetical protein
MQENELNELIVKELKKTTAFVFSYIASSEWICIQTYFLDIHNDTLVFYIKTHGDNIVLSDDGDTLRTLELSGIDIKSRTKQKIENICKRYGVVLEKNINELTITTKSIHKIHDLITTCLVINNMLYEILEKRKSKITK